MKKREEIHRGIDKYKKKWWGQRSPHLTLPQATTKNVVSLRQGIVPSLRSVTPPTTPRKEEIKGKTDKISYLERLEDQSIGITKRFV